ncbi:low affinity immunoglobulin gamma Fc region receptor III-like, partial [Prinia subflava]|uniref:low affinity immunoglobulin gamma Fc region receptor III-like n=1 Tax=Prinia subflava TaxID=208062 RepID=UPI002FE1EBDC
HLAAVARLLSLAEGLLRSGIPLGAYPGFSGKRAPTALLTPWGKTRTCQNYRQKAPLVLQVPARALLEGDTVTLHCRSWKKKSLTSVSFYHEEKDLGEPRVWTELSLSPLQLHHSGRYRYSGWVGVAIPQWRESELVTVTVHTVAVNVGRTLLFLVLLLAVIGGCHCWHHWTTRKPQDRTPPEKGVMLDPHIVGTEQAGGLPQVSPDPAPPRDPQVTNVELLGPYEGQQDPRDIYENVL